MLCICYHTYIPTYLVRGAQLNAFGKASDPIRIVIVTTSYIFSPRRSYAHDQLIAVGDESRYETQVCHNRERDKWEMANSGKEAPEIDKQ